MSKTEFPIPAWLTNKLMRMVSELACDNEVSPFQIFTELEQFDAYMDYVCDNGEVLNEDFSVSVIKLTRALTMCREMELGFPKTVKKIEAEA